MPSRSLLVLFCIAGTACAAEPSGDLRDGDIIFHSSRSAQSEALHRAMHSPYSHVGLLFLQEGQPVVLEAGISQRAIFDSELLEKIDER